MTYTKPYWRKFSWLLIGVTTALLTACATGPQVVSHSFSYDALEESPDVEVLDYRYGDDYVMTRAPEWRKIQGNVKQGEHITATFPRGAYLFVKWRIKATGEEFQDTVDLRHRLPANIKDHRIHFVIKGPQLYVYLVSPERRRSDEPKNGPSTYGHLKVITIYPDPEKS
ncbi:MAG: hypothetical protein V4488_04805 [Pseudomonadota bacterium]